MVVGCTGFFLRKFFPGYLLFISNSHFLGCVMFQRLSRGTPSACGEATEVLQGRKQGQHFGAV